MADNKYPIPIVRLIVPDGLKRILLLKRNDTSHAQGLWCLPGGKVDYDVTVEEACRKELFEETGLKCTGIRFLFYQDSLPPKSGLMHGINFYFECKVAGMVKLNRESSQYNWVGVESICLYKIALKTMRR